MAYKNMPNQTKMYFDDWKEYVFVEPGFQTDTFHVRRVSDGFYLSAHDNQKHVFWMEPNDDIWTWEQFTFSPDNNNILVTAHGTQVYMDPESEEMLQCEPEDPEADPEDPDSFGHLHPDFVFEPVPEPESEPEEPEEPKKEKKEKRPLSPKQLGLNLFMKTKKDKVRKENPDSAWGDQKKILGTMWKELSESQKAKWMKKASEE